MSDSRIWKIRIRKVSLAACLVVFLASWALASPPGSDPDGAFHLASTYCGSGYKPGICEPPSPEVEAQTPEFPWLLPVKVPQGVASATACAPGVPQESAKCYPGVLSDQTMVDTNQTNRGGLYPRGYYWVASKFVSKDIARTALTIRFFNIALFAFFLIAMQWVVKPTLRQAAYQSYLFTLLPLGTFLIASNNPSSWTITGIATFWVFLYSLLTHHSRRLRFGAGGLCVLSGLLAISSRADGALYMILCTGIIVVLVRIRDEATVREIAARTVWVLLLCFYALWVFFQTSQKRAVNLGLGGPGDFGRDPFDALLQNIFRILGHFAGIYGAGANAGGGLGWLDIQIPETAVVLLIISLGAFLVLCAGSRKRLEVLLVCSAVFLTLAIPLVSLYLDTAFVGENVQTRYSLPMVVFTVGLIASGSQTYLKLQESRVIPVALTAALGCANLISIHRVIRRYTTGVDVLGWDLNSPREWWWSFGPLPMTVLYASTATFAFLVFHQLHSKSRPKRATTPGE